MLRLFLFCTPLLAVTMPIEAQTAADSAGIRHAALDYIDGWYTGDVARMEKALHPDLAKRLVYTENGQSLLNQQSAMTLVQGTRAGYGKSTPEDRQRNEVDILDIYENVASVRVDATDWIDYLHLAKWNGEWKIGNVLWELRPEAR